MDHFSLSPKSNLTKLNMETSLHSNESAPRYHTFAILFVFTYLFVLFLGYKFKRLCSLLVSAIVSSLFCFGLFSKLQCINNTCTGELVNLGQAKTIALVSSIFLLSVTLAFYYITYILLALKHSLNVAILLLIACPFVFFYGVLGLAGTILQMKSLRFSSVAFQWIQLDLFLYYVIIMGIIWVFIEDLCFIRLKAYEDFRDRSERYNCYLKYFEQQDYGNITIGQYYYFQQLLDHQRQQSSLLPFTTTTNSYSVSNSPTLVRFAHQWKIDQFIRCDHCKDDSHFLNSGEFSSPQNDQIKFYLRICPRGIENDQENVSLFLHFKSQKSDDEITVGFVCSIVDSSGLKRQLKEKKCTFNREHNYHGWNDFINRNYLLNSFDLLPNETLTIHCEVSCINNEKDVKMIEIV